MGTEGRNPRRRRANGEESRNKILDAATEIASERGYEGTSIALVSMRSGLPASSIYWHFADKDALIAAVIERSFGSWLANVGAWIPLRPEASRSERMVSMMHQTAKALIESPDFLRLGLMLTLERRPTELTARTLFLQVRDEAHRRTVSSYTGFFPELDAPSVRQLATLTIALADGLFIAAEMGGDAFDVFGQFELAAAAILGAADQLAAAGRGPKR